MSVWLDRIAHAGQELGNHELALLRERDEFYALLVKARLEGGEGASAIAEAAGLSRQRLYQIIDKAKVQS